MLACGGCEQCQGHPFGGSCVAERNQDFPLLKSRLIDEINTFGIKGLAVADLNLLAGSYVNLSYPLANGSMVQFLRDNDIYLGNQVEQADSDRCYGIVASEDRFQLVDMTIIQTTHYEVIDDGYSINYKRFNKECYE